MGVRELAAAAVEARRVALEQERARNRYLHGDAAFALVKVHLNLNATVERAPDSPPIGDAGWGDDVIVRIEDDGGPLFVYVRVYRDEHTFRLCTENGSIKFPHPVAEQGNTLRDKAIRWDRCHISPPAFTDLVDMSKALTQYDEFMATRDKYVLESLNPYLNPDRIRMSDEKAGIKGVVIQIDEQTGEGR